MFFGRWRDTRCLAATSPLVDRFSVIPIHQILGRAHALAETRVIDLLHLKMARDPEMWHGSPSMTQHVGQPGSGTKVWGAAWVASAGPFPLPRALVMTP